MRRYAVVGFIILGVSDVSAQQADQPVAPSTPAPAAEKTVVPMEEARPGDRWIYEVRDEITGTLTGRRTTVVTEVTAKDIAMRVTSERNENERAVLFDKSWNVLRAGPLKHDPNDGTGIQAPLSVGKTWPIRSNDINSTNGNGWKRSGTSKVVEQEKLTTKAGTFETFRIESAFSNQNMKDPTMKSNVMSVTWYAPAINHWVKRTNVMRVNGRLMNSNSIELVEYGRKS